MSEDMLEEILDNMSEKNVRRNVRKYIRKNVRRYVNVSSFEHDWCEKWQSAVHHVFHRSRSSMANPVLLTSHSFAFLFGIALRDWFGNSSNKADCPACVVTCGSFSCPQISCTTGHIKLGPYTILLLTALVVIGLIGVWWIRFQWWKGGIGLSVGPRGCVDGRRVGAAIGWRPDTRQ